MSIPKTIATLVTGLGLVGGFAGVAGAVSGDISNTGPDSTNKIKFSNHSRVRVHNNNTVTASNSTNQSAYSGDAKVKHNTTGGDATSGDAWNDNSFDGTVNIDNSSSMDGLHSDSVGDVSGSIDTTGPDSTNKVIFSNKSKTSVTNNNTVTVSNSTTQNATSGDATVWGNTTGGNATSGEASNTNSSTLSVSVSN